MLLIDFLSFPLIDTTGIFNISRCAHGHKNHIVFEVYGTEGVISFDLNNPEILNVCVGELDLNSGKTHQISVPAEYRLSQEQAFIRAVKGKPEAFHPTIEDGLRCQKIIDAVLLSSEQGKWIDV
jgi:predicted dehydrogenase